MSTEDNETRWARMTVPVGELGEAFTSELSPDARKLASTQYSPPDKGNELSVVHLCVMYKIEEEVQPPELLKKFAELVNYVVEVGLIEAGCAHPPVYMELCSACTECGRLYGAVGPRTVEEDHANCIEKHGGTPPLQRRGMLMMYPLSQYKRKSLNMWLLYEFFVEEGILSTVNLEDVDLKTVRSA